MGGCVSWLKMEDVALSDLLRSLHLSWTPALAPLLWKQDEAWQHRGPRLALKWR